jgi:hypothetical protein
MLSTQRQEGATKQGHSRETATSKSYTSGPAISLPKGGGAIRGIDEKFSVNPATGTGSLSVPIFTTPGRSDFYPKLSLSYDSGAGNGPFGLGWSLSVPSITRKTDKGLPKYRDAEESDTFILSGAEDLVPALRKQGDNWEKDVLERAVDGTAYVVHRYRPRTEGLFARIERWEHEATGETHWRSVTKENVTSIYGRSEDSRIADPDDPNRVFQWLLEESYDDKGNIIAHEYKQENSQDIDPSLPQEKNRLANGDSYANRYLKRIKYGNRKPFEPSDWLFEVVFDYGEHDPENPTPDEVETWPARLDAFSSFRAGFEIRTQRLCQRVLIFHHFQELGGIPCLVRSTDLEYCPLLFSLAGTWSEILNDGTLRKEFARAGTLLSDDLAVTTEVAGSRWLLTDRAVGEVYLVKTEGPRLGVYVHEENRVASFLYAVRQMGYVRKENGDGYISRSLPPLEFTYTKAKIDETVCCIDAASLENLPIGLDGAQYQWVDLDGEGVAGILTEQGTGWFYKRNLGGFRFDLAQLAAEGLPSPPTLHPPGAVRFAPARLVASKPSLANLRGGRQQILDLAGDGQKDLVLLGDAVTGFYERDDGYWASFRPFQLCPDVNWSDPNLRLIDLNGDGHADILVSNDEVFVWYASQGEDGFGPSECVRKLHDEEQGPALVFADAAQSIYLADMNGDGLVDIVRIRNGEVCYWPSLGYARFGAKVTMGTPSDFTFDSPDQFNQQRIRLADIDGSGTTDIIYLGRDEVSLCFNQAGNSWSAPYHLTSFPATDNISSVMVADLLGNGTACLVWSSPLPNANGQPMRYVDLMGGQKPHLLSSVRNNLGAETRLQYAPSTKYYLEDLAAGKPWITKLHFPVHVVERVEVREHVTGTKLVTLYRYHHGYYDGEEREFRGFGLVEQWDTEFFPQFTGAGLFTSTPAVEDEEFHLPPVYTRTWFHTGAYIDRDHVSRQYTEEYYDGDPQAVLLLDTILPPGLSAQEEREACRALKGRVLRQEVYALDTDSDKSEHPYTVTETNYHVKQIQPMMGQRHAVFYTHERETLSYRYERDPDDPRISQAMTLEVDNYGNVRKAVTIGYPRRPTKPKPGEPPPPPHPDEQRLPLITYTETDVINKPNEAGWYRVGVPCQRRTYELTGYTPLTGGRYACADFVVEEGDGIKLVCDKEILHEDSPAAGKQRRLIEQQRTLYYDENLAGPLPLGEVTSLALPYETYNLAFTPGLLKRLFVDSGKITAEELADVLKTEGGYRDLDGDGHWWIPSGRAIHFPVPDNPPSPLVPDADYARQHFYLPQASQDPFGHYTWLQYDRYDQLLKETRDPLGNVVTVVTQDDEGDALVALDYCVMQPWLVTDPNHNRSAVAFDTLGLVVGTAVMGKRGEEVGDSLAGFERNLDESDIIARLDCPLADSHTILKQATTRLVYDLWRYHRTRQVDENGEEHGQPVVVWRSTPRTRAATRRVSSTASSTRTAWAEKSRPRSGPSRGRRQCATRTAVRSSWRMANPR